MRWIFLGWQMLLASVVILIALYLPGCLLLRGLRVSLKRLEYLVAALVTGAASMVLCYWALSYLKVSGLIWAYVLLTAAAEVGLKFRDYKSSQERIPDPETIPEPYQDYWPLAGIMLLGIILQTRFTFMTGWPGPQGLQLLAWHTHDATWHIFNLWQMAHTFPPEMPGFAGRVLQNYHMFSDLLWGALLRLAPLDPWHIYFRIAPVFYSGLLTLTTFVAVKAWSHSSRTAYLAVALTMFGSNFGYVLPALLGSRNYFLWDSIFWVSSPFMNIFNPGVSSSYLFLIMGLWALIHWLQDKHKGFLVLLALLWGVLPGFKVYPGLLAIAALLATGLYVLGFRRQMNVLLALAALLPVFLAVFLPPNWQAPTLVRFLPGFNLGTMLVAPDRMALLSSAELKTWYIQQPWLVVLLLAGLLVIFLLGNLGVRSIGLWRMAQALFRPQQADPILLFITFLVGSALAGAVLLVQVGMPWNTIQFFYYAVLLSAWPAAAQFWDWVKVRKPYPTYLLLSLMLLFGLPGVIQAWQVVRFGTSMGPKMYQGLQWLKQNAPAPAKILRPLPDALMTDQGYQAWQRTQVRGRMTSLSAWKEEAKGLASQSPSPTPLPTPAISSVAATLPIESRKEKTASASPTATSAAGPSAWPILERTDTAVVAALTFHNTYVEDTINAQIMGYPIEQRVKSVRSFYQDMDVLKAREFLEQEGITYVILWQGMQLPFDPAGANLKLIFKNEALTIFKYISSGGW